MNKYEILFKTSRRARKLLKWERFGNDIVIALLEAKEALKEEYDNPVILSVREIPFKGVIK